jgi:hypothetical protein
LIDAAADAGAVEFQTFTTSRMNPTIAFNSTGAREALWSGPGNLESSVKCFLIALAPSATAATRIAIPALWSDKPVDRAQQ